MAHRREVFTLLINMLLKLFVDLSPANLEKNKVANQLSLFSFFNLMGKTQDEALIDAICNLFDK